MTLGGVGSYIDVDDERYTSVDFKLRYYPGEVVLRGFSVGAERRHFFATATFARWTTRESLDAPTLGVIVDYNWMLGAKRRFLVGTGVGAKRVLASAEERRTGGPRPCATHRAVRDWLRVLAVRPIGRRAL